MFFPFARPTRRPGQHEPDGQPAAEAVHQPEPRFFAIGIRRDQQAVTAGRTLLRSGAAAEGNPIRARA
jgi:hypothetical protein